MWAHVNDPPPDPRARRPELAPALVDVVLRAMAKDPQQRFATAGEFARAAVAAAEGEADGSPRPFAFSRSDSWGNSGALRPTHREKNLAPGADRGPEVTARLQPRWRTRWAFAGGTAFLIAGAVIALLALGVLGGREDPRVVAVRTTAKKTVSVAGKAGGLAQQLGALSQKLTQSQDPSTRGYVAQGSTSVQQSAASLAAQLHDLAASPGSQNNWKLRVLIDQLAQTLAALNGGAADVAGAAKNPSNPAYINALANDSKAVAAATSAIHYTISKANYISKHPGVASRPTKSKASAKTPGGGSNGSPSGASKGSPSGGSSNGSPSAASNGSPSGGSSNGSPSGGSSNSSPSGGWNGPLDSGSTGPAPGDTGTGTSTLGGLDLSTYCQNQGLGDASLSGQQYDTGAAWNWSCADGGQSLMQSDMDAACVDQYGNSQATAQPTDENDAYSWTCYG